MDPSITDITGHLFVKTTPSSTSHLTTVKPYNNHDNKLLSFPSLPNSADYAILQI